MKIHPDAPTVTLFSQPGCGPCIGAARHMTNEGIPYVKVDITADPNAADRVRELGYAGTPVTTVGDMHWHGYRQNKIVELKSALESWTPATTP